VIRSRKSEIKRQKVSDLARAMVILHSTARQCLAFLAWSSPRSIASNCSERDDVRRPLVFYRALLNTLLPRVAGPLELKNRFLRF
jgi:hypothetical protein